MADLVSVPQHTTLPISFFAPLFGFLCFHRLATRESLAGVILCFLCNASEDLRLGFRRVKLELGSLAVEHRHLPAFAKDGRARFSNVPTNGACVCPPDADLVSVRPLRLSFAFHQL